MSLFMPIHLICPSIYVPISHTLPSFPSFAPPSFLPPLIHRRNPRSDNPLIVHIADAAQLHELAADGAVGANAWRLACAFWPGPLSLIVEARRGLISARVCVCAVFFFRSICYFYEFHKTLF